MSRATTRPRRAGVARSAAKGIMTWPPTEASPVARAATWKTHRDGESADTTTPSTARAYAAVRRRRRGWRSPRGTTKTSAAA